MEQNEYLKKTVQDAIVPYWSLLGIEPELNNIEKGKVTLLLPMKKELGTRFTDVMHGGAISSLIDAAAATCTSTLRPEDEEWAGWVTTDLNVSYLNAAMKDVRAEAKAIRAGRTIVYVQVDVIDSDEKFVASGRVTYLILRPR
ncbi:MAG: PaaI family thioesterase [Dehalococcoidia bacterium]|nr:PaaI family thioesterase [Dehalococcoidia bacterium]